MVFLGIDGGGTKSRLAVCDEKGTLIGRYEGGTTNIASNPVEIVEKNIKELVGQFLKESGFTYQECKKVCIGSAGIDTPENTKSMEQVLARIGFRCPVLVVNDAEIIVWAEMKAHPGIVIISGTGSVAYGKDESGRIKRCGGWGHLFDDEGSGYWIGKEILRRTFQAYDGRGRTTMLTSLLLQKFKLENIQDILPLVYHEDFQKQDIAALSILSSQAATAGDLTARGILTEAAEELAKIVFTLQKELQLDSKTAKIIISGGNILNNSFLKKTFCDKVKEKCRIAVIEAEQEPVMGAIYLARTIGGKQIEYH